MTIRSRSALLSPRSRSRKARERRSSRSASAHWLPRPALTRPSCRRTRSCPTDWLASSVAIDSGRPGKSRTRGAANGSSPVERAIPAMIRFVLFSNCRAQSPASRRLRSSALRPKLFCPNSAACSSVLKPARMRLAQVSSSRSDSVSRRLRLLVALPME
ncbi:hypothetical protein D3C84_875420 [compost metagenome]